MNRDNNYNSGFGLGDVLAIVFIILKLCKVINWSWIWVLSPLWISLIIYIILVIIIKIIS